MKGGGGGGGGGIKETSLSSASVGLDSKTIYTSCISDDNTSTNKVKPVHPLQLRWAGGIKTDLYTQIDTTATQKHMKM